MMALFSTTSFCYYLIGYQIKYLKGNVFINGLVSEVSEIIGFLVSGKQI